MKEQPTLILVLGMPGSGKTTLAKKLSKEFALPLISKDDIKVILFDVYGWKDREWSKLARLLKPAASTYKTRHIVS